MPLENIMRVEHGKIVGASPGADPVVSDVYNQENVYSTTANRYCIKDNKLYKCNTENTTGVWDASKWDETTVADELEGIDSKEVPMAAPITVIDINHLIGTTYNNGEFDSPMFTVPKTGNYVFYGNINNVSATYCTVSLRLVNENGSLKSVLAGTAAGVSTHAYPERSCVYIPVYLKKGTKVCLTIYHASTNACNANARLLSHYN